MLRHVLFSLRHVAPLALLLCISDAWAISVTPSPSYNGSYTVSWSTTLGCWTEDFYPYYPEHCYSLQQNGVDIAWSGNSLPVSGKPVGSYTYRIYYRLTVAGSPWDEYTVEGPVTVQVLPPPPSFSLSDAPSTTEGSAMVFTVTRSGTTTGSYSVNYASSNGTAHLSDFTAVSGTLTFASGETSKTISVPTTQDASYENSETILMDLSSPTGGATISDDFGWGYIANDDAVPQFSISDVTVSEGNFMNFVVTRTGETQLIFNVNWATAVGTAGTVDFTHTSGTLEFTSSDTSKVILLTATEDAIYESTERMYVNLSGATFSDSQGYGDITNDDAPPSFSINDVGVTEGGTLSFTVTKSGDTEVNHNVSYMSTDSSAVASSDYSAVSGTLTFTSGGQATQSVAVSTANDAVYEGNELLVVTLSNATSGATIGDASGVGTINNDDAGPSFAINDVSAGEGGTLSFTVTKSGLTALTHDVSYATAIDTAGGSDFTATSGTLSFTSGEATKAVYVTTTADGTYESTERLHVNLSSATNGSAIGDSQGYGDITNDDPGPSFAINDVTVGEGGTLSFTVTKTGSTELSHNVSYATGVGTAESGDFSATSGMLSFASGEATRAVYVSTAQDSTYEGTERLYVNLSSATGGATIADSQGFGDIANDDAGPSFTINDVSITEGGALSFTVTKNGATAFGHDVSYAAAAGTASSADFTAASGTLSFGSGEGTKTVNVSTAPDSTYESTERLYVNLSNATSGATIGDSQGYGDIIDNDVPATPDVPSAPSYDYDGNYLVSFSSPTGADWYLLQEQVNGGGWSTIHNGAGTSKNVTATSEGTREYQASACSAAGCSGYSAIAQVVIVLPPTTSGDVSGAIPAGFSVGTQGDASYTIPITVPPGTGGLKPSLALSYNHLAGNGLAGMRWTLSGISAITRCGKTFAQDSVATAVNYSSSDRYCLNGQRLVSLDDDGTIDDDDYHLAGTEYRTEIESFQRIIQENSGASTSFYVDHGNGLRSYFGETSNARVAGAGGLTRTWYISRTVDPFGNTVAYSYDTSTADGPLPETITWTGNSTTNPALLPRYAITITYDTRPTDDLRSGHDSGGAPWSRTQRIESIAVTHNGAPIGTYDLTYRTPPTSGTGRSQLEKVELSRGSDALPETVFTLQDGDRGWSGLSDTGRSVGTYPSVGDMDGDGRQDIFVCLSSTWQVYPGQSDGSLGVAVDSTVSCTTDPEQARVLDYDGNGRADLLYRSGSNWRVLKSIGGGGFINDTTVLTTSGVQNPAVLDLDGDGLSDVVYDAGGALAWQRNLGGSFAAQQSIYQPNGTLSGYGPVPAVNRSVPMDANRDGRADLVVEVEECEVNPNNPYELYCINAYYLLLATGTGWNTFTEVPITTMPEGYQLTNFRSGDVNGDGLPDLLYVHGTAQTWHLRLNQGTGLGSSINTQIGPEGADKVMIVDYDADGRDDLVRVDASLSNIYAVHRSNGGTLVGYTSFDSVGAYTATAFAADLSGDGFPEIVRVSGSTWRVHEHLSPLPDVVTKFTNGLGREVSVAYEPLSNTSHYTLSWALAEDPPSVAMRRYGGPRYVVTTETHDTGIGSGTRALSHDYGTAWVDVTGRGWQSFGSHTITDTVQGTYSVTEYSRAFPTAGMVTSVELSTLGSDGVIGGSDDRLVRSVAATLPAALDMALAGSAPPRQFPRVEQTTTLENEIAGAGELLRTIVDNPEYDLEHGYVTDTTRTVTQPGVSGAWVTATDFDRGANDVETANLLCLGLPGTVVTSNTLPGGSPVTRTVEYEFNGCSLDAVTDLSESDPAKQLVRELDFDGFGNVVTVSEYAVGAPTDVRTTTFDFDDADPQFPESVTVGGVNLTTYLEFDPRLGLRTAVTGPDGLTTSFEYDVFGRLTREERPAGSTDVSYRQCTTCFAPEASFYVKAADSTGATAYTFFDVLERPVGSDSPLAAGRRSREQIAYLANGLVEKRSLPYVAGEGVHWVTMTYDAIGRTKTEDDEEAGTTATYDYLGHELKVTDGNAHPTRYIHNALGQIKQVIDAAGGNTFYTYHPFGELATVTDHASNVTTIAYDARGYKLWMFDPDMGLNSVSDRWEYVHNAFGELIQHTDAKNHVVTLEYDDAGRLEERHEPEGTTYFTYYPHNAPTAGHAGRLQQTTSPGGLSEVFEYHPTHGAVTQITRSIGASSYDLDFSFDTHGRLSQITYPTNVDAQRLGVEYLYDGWGALWQVRNAATPSLVYYTLNAQSGSGAERRVTLGNGVVEQYGYEAATGRLESIQTGPAGSATLQNLSYEWDLAGNLEQRVDQLLSRTELFYYDALDRLTSVVRNSSTIFSLTYNNLIGNISSKTDSAGTIAYSYGSSRPHAVTAFGTMTFGYDTNGNMTNRDGGAITWTSYNLPSRIERSSGEYSEFLYGADRSRYRQIEGSGALSSTRHYASPGLFEVLTWNGGASRVDYHYIHANGRAVAQFTTSNVEADELQYLHRDHQGSVVATTSTGGAVLDRFEYDPFGQRTTTVGNDDRMHRGYTGHEHLEALDLIHMNGRVQDPVIGRFLSPDPFVQAPYQSQSLNRYSYVWNNPMSLVDPSGFQTDERLPPVPCELTLSRGGSWTCQGPSLPPIVDEERNHSPSVDGGDGGGYAFAHVNTSVPVAYPGLLNAPLEACSSAGMAGGCFSADITPYGYPFHVYSADPDLLYETVEEYAEIYDQRFDVLKDLTIGWLMPVEPESDLNIRLAGNRLAPLSRVTRAVALRSVAIGKRGETLVRKTYNIGAKTSISVAGRVRIPDGLTGRVLSEVKNVRSLNYTQQLRDFAAYAQRRGLRFDLYVRRTTELSVPLQEAVAAGTIRLRYIPVR